jgi:hypothetical protein
VPLERNGQYPDDDNDRDPAADDPAAMADRPGTDPVQDGGDS